MNSRCAGGSPEVSTSVFSGNLVGLPIPNQRQRPASVLAYRSRPLDATAVMLAPASVRLVRVHRAWMDLVAAVKRTSTPEESRLKFQTSLRTTFSARRG